MVRPLMTDTVFLAQKALPADADDITVADDLLDTLKAHEDGCVGMAANMIGVNKAIIVFDNDGTPCEMFNPVIVYRKGLYLAEVQTELQDAQAALDADSENADLLAARDAAQAKIDELNQTIADNQAYLDANAPQPEETAQPEAIEASAE